MASHFLSAILYLSTQCDTRTKGMNDLLTNTEAIKVFRTFYGHCSDSLWYRNKKIFNDSFPMNIKNVQLVAQLKRLCPRLNIFDFDFVSAIKQTGEETNKLSNKVTGYDFLYFLQENNIKPHRNTITNWFQDVGGFRQKKVYLKCDLYPVILAAYSLKRKNENAGIN